MKTCIRRAQGLHISQSFSTNGQAALMSRLADSNVLHIDMLISNNQHSVRCVPGADFEGTRVDISTFGMSRASKFRRYLQYAGQTQ
ncbi:MAG TPA: hypothetical protein VF780_00340 [Nitrosospira sp.]